MPGQATLQLVLSVLYGSGGHTMHQARTTDVLDDIYGDDGIPPDVIFGNVRFCDYNNTALTIANASIQFDDPDLHLIDFVAVPNSTLWRLRFWGGVSGRSYRARISVPTYAVNLVALAVDRAVSERPVLTINVVGLTGGVEDNLVGVLGNEVVSVTGAVGV